MSARNLLGLLARLTHRASDLTADYDAEGKLIQPPIVPAGDPTATIATSAIEEDRCPPRHYVLLDLDVPAYLVPSSTPGHSHLYIEKKVAWYQLQAILETLAAADIVEKGYAGVSIARGYTALRLPWVKKVKAEPAPAPVPEPWL